MRNLLVICSYCRPTSIDDDVRAGHVRRRFAGEKDNRTLVIVGSSHPPQQGLARIVLYEEGVLRVLDTARRERIGAHSLVSPVSSEKARERDDRTLGRRVGSRLVEWLSSVGAFVDGLVRADESVGGRDVDDAALSLARHLRAKDLGAEKSASNIYVEHLPP